MQEEIRHLLESFVVEHWGRIVYDQILLKLRVSQLERGWDNGCAENPGNVTDLPLIFSNLAVTQQIEFDDLIHAFGMFCFLHYASKVPSHERLESHPKKFLMTMHRLLNLEKGGNNFAHFHYVDCAPEELLMIYKTKQSFSSFVQGFVDGAAQSFAHQIDCDPVEVRDGEISGCRFHLRFRGEL